jgi:hypothetical protein
LDTFWSPPKAHFSSHELTAGPVLVTVTAAVKPVLHWFCTVYATVQPAVAAEAVVVNAAPAPAATTSIAPAANAADRRRGGGAGGALLM